MTGASARRRTEPSVRPDRRPSGFDGYRRTAGEWLALALLVSPAAVAPFLVVWPWPWLAYTAIGMCMLGLGMTAALTYRTNRRLVSHRWRICRRCRYPLPSRPALGVCPECGIRYRRGDVRRAWRQWMDPARPGGRH